MAILTFKVSKRASIEENSIRYSRDLLSSLFLASYLDFSASQGFLVGAFLTPKYFHYVVSISPGFGAREQRISLQGAYCSSVDIVNDPSELSLTPHRV